MQKMQVRSLGQKESLEEETTAHSSILAWRIPWTEKPGASVHGSQKGQTKSKQTTDSIIAGPASSPYWLLDLIAVAVCNSPPRPARAFDKYLSLKALLIKTRIF